MICPIPPDIPIRFAALFLRPWIGQLKIFDPAPGPMSWWVGGENGYSADLLGDTLDGRGLR
jgi:hypothetical protein